MAKKISELTELFENPNGSDVVPIVDISTGETKKVEFNQFAPFEIDGSGRLTRRDSSGDVLFTDDIFKVLSDGSPFTISEVDVGGTPYPLLTGKPIYCDVPLTLTSSLLHGQDGLIIKSDYTQESSRAYFNDFTTGYGGVALQAIRESDYGVFGQLYIDGSSARISYVKDESPIVLTRVDSDGSSNQAQLLLVDVLSSISNGTKIELNAPLVDVQTSLDINSPSTSLGALNVGGDVNVDGDGQFGSTYPVTIGSGFNSTVGNEIAYSRVGINYLSVPTGGLLWIQEQNANIAKLDSTGVSITNALTVGDSVDINSPSSSLADLNVGSGGIGTDGDVTLRNTNSLLTLGSATATTARIKLFSAGGDANRTFIEMSEGVTSQNGSRTGYDSLNDKWYVNMLTAGVATRAIEIDRATLDISITNDLDVGGVYKTGGTSGVSGSFTSNDGKTITVTNGIVTSIV